MRKTLSGKTKSPRHVNMCQQKQPGSLPLYIGAKPRKQNCQQFHLLFMTEDITSILFCYSVLNSNTFL